MTTKDWVYLGLVLLTALAFYCNGFYAGVYRCKRMYDSMLEEPEPGAHAKGQDANFISEEENILATVSPVREPKVALSSRDLKGTFGEN